MKNNITEDYCSFELDQLLLRKGCDLRLKIDKFFGIKYQKVTHALAIKWIRENFGIHITSTVDLHSEKHTFQISYWKQDKKDPSQKTWKVFEKKSTEAALLYTLKNLI